MSDMATSHAPHRITVEEYRRMGDAGVFAPDARLELIEGALIESMAPMKPPHASAVMNGSKLWTLAFRDVAVVRCQLPITLGDVSEPEPDLAIVCGPASRYVDHHPSADEIFALVEVSETSRMFDITRKVPMYAGHGIREVWIVDLADGCIRAFRDSDGSVYREQSIIPRDQSCAFAAFPHIAFDLCDIF